MFRPGFLQAAHASLNLPGNLGLQSDTQLGIEFSASLKHRGELGVPRRGTVPLAVVGVAASAYTLWAIVGAGAVAVGWGAVLLALGVPLYFLMRKKS